MPFGLLIGFGVFAVCSRYPVTWCQSTGDSRRFACARMILPLLLHLCLEPCLDCVWPFPQLPPGTSVGAVITRAEAGTKLALQLSAPSASMAAGTGFVWV